MRAISGILGALFLLLLVAAMGSAGIAMGWFGKAEMRNAPSWPILVGLAMVCAVLSVVAFRQSKKSADLSSTRHKT